MPDETVAVRPGFREKALASLGAMLGMLALPIVYEVSTSIGPAARVVFYAYLPVDDFGHVVLAALVGTAWGAEAYRPFLSRGRRYSVFRTVAGCLLGMVGGVAAGVIVALLVVPKALSLGAICVGGLLGGWYGGFALHKAVEPDPRMGIKRRQVDHPLPLGEGRGEGTALHVESCRGRGHSTLVNSASGSAEASPSPPNPSPGGRGVTRFEDLCPQITNGHLDTRLTRPMPDPRGRRFPWARLAALVLLVFWSSIPHFRAFPARGTLAERDGWARKNVREYAGLVRTVSEIPAVTEDVGRVIGVAPTPGDQHRFARDMDGDEMRFTLEVVGDRGAGIFWADCTIAGGRVSDWRSSRWTYHGKATPIADVSGAKKP